MTSKCKNCWMFKKSFSIHWNTARKSKLPPSPLSKMASVKEKHLATRVPAHSFPQGIWQLSSVFSPYTHLSPDLSASPGPTVSASSLMPFWSNLCKGRRRRQRWGKITGESNWKSEAKENGLYQRALGRKRDTWKRKKGGYMQRKSGREVKNGKQKIWNKGKD